MLMQNLPVAGNSPDLSIVHPERDVESDHGLATLDVSVNVLGNVSLLGSSTQKQFYLLQESGLAIFIQVFVAG
jgi:hypothetical protein